MAIYQPTSNIALRLEQRSGVPPYLQIVRQVEHAIRLGYLCQGDQLPRVKDAVAALSVNPNTVLKAYRDLEQKGLVAARPGLGTFVIAAPETVDLELLSSLRRRFTTGWLKDAAAAGLDEEQIVALLSMAMQDMREAPAEAVDSIEQSEGVA
jgi:GntR family transcriptional regulator